MTNILAKQQIDKTKNLNHVILTREISEL
jgi:hypothetical protein